MLTFNNSDKCSLLCTNCLQDAEMTTKEIIKIINELVVVKLLFRSTSAAKSKLIIFFHTELFEVANW